MTDPKPILLFDLDGTTPVGSYTVEVDRSWMEPPYEILRIEVLGLSGDPAEPPIARRRISVEVDMAEQLRGGGGANPNLGRFMNFQDHGAL